MEHRISNFLVRTKLIVLKQYFRNYLPVKSSVKSFCGKKSHLVTLFCQISIVKAIKLRALNPNSSFSITVVMRPINISTP